MGEDETEEEEFSLLSFGCFSFGRSCIHRAAMSSDACPLAALFFLEGGVLVQIIFWRRFHSNFGVVIKKANK